MTESKRETLRAYLRGWAAWCRRWRPRGLWYPSAVPWADQVKGSPSESGEGETDTDTWIYHAIEQAVSSLPSALGKAIRSRYLREAHPAEGLADQAETALIPRVEARNVIL